MSAEDRALVRVAESVADGRPVDWNAVEKTARGAEQRYIRHLRLVESIGALYRTVPPEPDELSPEAAPEPEGPSWGRHVLLDRIGEGTSCDVYRAWDSALHRDVALKLFHEEAGHPRDMQLRVLDEARRLARIRHEHIVHVYGAEQHDSRVGLWMELVRGESLEEILRARGPLGADEAALIGLELCAALAAVHGAGLLHRDVKAQNVMRENGGRIVLMDFGTGEELRHDLGTSRLVGTPLYLAPELFRRESASVQSDLYSLGVLLFYLVTGAFPAAARTMDDLARAHASGDMRRLRDLRPDVPEAFVRVVERALDPSPSARYRTAGDMEAALRQALHVSQVDAGQPVVTVARGSRAWVPLIAALALLIGVATLIVWSRGQPAAPTAPAVTTIAVLPLRDVSQSGAASYVADALTDGVISTLGHATALRVTSGTSSMRYRDVTQPAREIARALGVDALVEGTVAVEADRTGPERVRVNIRVIAASTDTSIFSYSLVRPRGDLDALEGEIVLSIAKALEVSVSPEQTSRLARFRVTSPAAEQAYLEGRAALAQYGVAPAARAVQALERAIHLDPNHPDAHAGLSRAYVTLGLFGGMLHQEARARGLAAARRALDLDDHLAEAHAAQANLQFYYDWDWPGAGRSYQRSLALNRSFTYARSYYAQFLAARRRFDEALEHAAEALALDPQSSEAEFLPGLLLYYKGDYQAAENVLRALPGREVMLGRVLEAQGRIDQALEITTRMAPAPDSAGVPLRVQIVRLQALAGHQDAAAAGLAALLSEARDGAVNLTSRDLGYMYLAMGRNADAMAAFEKALRERDPTLVWFAVDPRLAPIRADPRFQKILATMAMQ